MQCHATAYASASNASGVPPKRVSGGFRRRGMPVAAQAQLAVRDWNRARSFPLRNALAVAGLYAVRRRPVDASLTAPKKSVRCSESRCGNSSATSARNGSFKIDSTSSSRRLRSSRTS